jgi:glycosyltransferase involved in cell wall biosynthesis
MSNALLEAMALARPVVATDTGGNPELVEDGVTGRLVPVDAPEVLADTIGDLLTQPLLARRLGEAARRRVARDFSFSRTRAAHEALYRSLAPR